MVMACMCLAEERAQHAVPLQEKGKTLDAAGRIGEVEPDFYTAEVGAFGADWSGDIGA